MGSRTLAVVVAMLALLALDRDAIADEPPPARIELRHSLAIDGAATIGMGCALIAWTVVRDDVIASSCRICDGPGTKVNAVDAWFRDELKRDDVGPARTISNIVSYGVAPLTLVTLATLAAADHDQLGDAPTDLLLITEGVMAALVVSESLKPLTLRERPDFHATSSAEDRARYPSTDEPFLSFPSGHGGTIFAMTSAAGVIAMQRNYRLAPLIWVAGIAMGIASGYMRIAADRHYFTDVLAGFGLGGGIGGMVPWLFHQPKSGMLERATLGAQPVRGGRAITLTWAF